jgi:hypothetical protein
MARAKPKPSETAQVVAALKAVGALLAELRGTLPAKARDECDAALAAIDALPSSLDKGSG